MRETKLFHHLTLLSEQERKQFRRYLASPYFNGQSRYVQLFDILDQQLLRYKLRPLSEQQAWELYFSGQPYDQNKFRKECTALLKLLTDFIAQQAFDEDRPQQLIYLLRRLNALGETAYFPGYAEEAHRVVEEAASQPNYDKKVTIGIEQYRHDLDHARRNSTLALGELVDTAELHYCTQKMELLYVELNHLLVTGKGQRREDPAFLALVEMHLTELPVLTRMFYHLYQCTLDPAAEHHFHVFRNFLQDPHLQREHLLDMYTAALNYCARRLNAGVSTHYLRETHDLHREMLELELLTPAHHLISPIFKNAVVVASRLGEFAWAKELMHRFEETLQLPANIIAYHFSAGIIAFHEGYLKEAEPHFHRVLDDFEDVFYGLDTRGYLLRIYYETNNLIGLDALLDSYRMYLKRNQGLPGARKASHNEFIRFVRRLAHCNPHDQGALLRLQTEIEAGRRMPFTGWLLVKVGELMDDGRWTMDD
jgi:hypothetical protein